MPVGCLIQYNGSYYGMTGNGGANSKGTIFELIPGTTPTEKVLWSFGGAGDGSLPASNLLLGNDGKLYGMTFQGGTFNVGAVVSIQQH